MVLSQRVREAAAWSPYHTIHNVTTKSLVRILEIADQTAQRMSLADDAPISVPGSYYAATPNEAS